MHQPDQKDKGENGWLEIPIDQLVPGDIIKLAAGDMIPADLRILQARDLFVAQASLTGESLPVEKAATTRQPEHSNPLECDTLCFMGTTVVSGTAQAMVIATGANTWFGQLAGRVSEQPGLVPAGTDLHQIQQHSLHGWRISAQYVRLLSAHCCTRWYIRRFCLGLPNTRC